MSTDKDRIPDSLRGLVVQIPKPSVLAALEEPAEETPDYKTYYSIVVLRDDQIDRIARAVVQILKDEKRL